MVSRRLIGLTLGIAATAMCDARAQRADWTDYISDIVPIGMDVTKRAADVITKNKKLRTPLLDDKVGTMGSLLSFTQAIPEMVKRQQDYNLGAVRAFLEQATISGSGWMSGNALTDIAVGSCVTVAGCVVLSAGIGIDATLIEKDVEGGLDLLHENQQLAASQQLARIAQERLNQERSLKQLLHVQRSTQQWQAQRSLQLALQSKSVAPNPNPVSVPAISKPTVHPAVTRPDPSATSASGGSPASGGIPGVAAKTLPVGTPVNTAPMSPVVHAPPITIKVPGIVGGSPTMVDMTIPSIGPANSGTSTPSAKSQTTTTPAATARSVIIGTPVAVGTPVTVLPGSTTTATLNAPVLSSPAAKDAASASPMGAQRPTPGGISLSRAAADRMPLQIALDSSAVSNGKILLSGRASETRMDAALFLTALRAACDDHDPYFSLDPDNGALWSQQGDQASNEFWEGIKKDLGPEPPGRTNDAHSGVVIRTISATQNYPNIWQAISPRYPDFRSRLVFYPEWLRQTRLGEILYKGDVLLKELSSGVTILVPGTLRASAIAGYLSADTEYAAKTLLAGARDQVTVRPQWRGSRLWFDIAPSELPTTTIDETSASSPSGDPALASLLRSRRLVRSTDHSVQNASFVVRHGTVFDLSQVNPIMFVRVHDHVTNRDLSDHDPKLDGLASDVSTRFDQYAEYYDELRMLREVFRAYIAARKITNANQRLCDKLVAMPLLDSEKLPTTLPDYHPSELFVTIGSYSTTSKTGGQTQFVRTSSMSGGVSIAGQQFDETATRDGETMITRALEAAIAGGLRDPLSPGDPDRKFISFSVEDASGASVRLASNAGDLSSSRSLSDYLIDNEPTPSTIRRTSRTTRTESSTIIGLVVTLFILGFALKHLARGRRGVRG